MLIILNECISFELTIGQKVCKFLSLYRSPCQNRDEFETFLENLELNFDHMADKIPIWWLSLVILMQNRTLGILMRAQILKDRKLTF